MNMEVYEMKVLLVDAAVCAVGMSGKTYRSAMRSRFVLAIRSLATRSGSLLVSTASATEATVAKAINPRPRNTMMKFLQLKMRL